MVDPFLKVARSLTTLKTTHSCVSIVYRRWCYEVLPMGRLCGIDKHAGAPLLGLADETVFSRPSACRFPSARFVSTLKPSGSASFEIREESVTRSEIGLAENNGAFGVQVCVADVHNQRGLALCQAGDNPAALIEFDRAVLSDPSLAEAYNNRGAIRLALGDTKGAFTDYSAALSLKPNYAEAFNNRGAARQSLGDMDGALADYDRAIGLKPNYAQAYDNRGVVQSYHWNHAAAVADFDSALRFYDDNPQMAGRICALLVCRANSRYHLNDRLGALSTSVAPPPSTPTCLPRASSRPSSRWRKRI